MDKEDYGTNLIFNLDKISWLDENFNLFYLSVEESLKMMATQF